MSLASCRRARRQRRYRRRHLRIELSGRAVELLRQLRATGLHDPTVRDVAARIIDRELARLAQPSQGRR